MINKKFPPKWFNVYPANTKTGDEEAIFFVALARNKKYKFRSVAQLSKITKLSEKRVEEIINKYLPSNIVVQSQKNEEHFAYWENAKSLLPDQTESISNSDKNKRIKESN